MGTYSDESPDAGIVERATNAISKTVKSARQLMHNEPVTMGGNNPANKEAADEASVSSNTGAAGQSTDSYNKY